MGTLGVLTDSIAQFKFIVDPFLTSRGPICQIRGKNNAATWAGVYLVGLSKKNDLGWSFRQMRAKSVKINLKMITNRGVFCGQIPPALKKIINATRRRFSMRSFYLVMALLENIVIMVIIDFQCFTEKANGILGERLNGTLRFDPSLVRNIFCQKIRKSYNRPSSSGSTS
jgi:hypothetical protein